MWTADDIREARDSTGESQAAFAKRFGIDQSTLHRWETNGPPERGAAGRLIDHVMAGLGRKPRTPPQEVAA